MNKLNSSNSFELNVTDEFLSVMFVARVSYNKASAFSDIVKPFITNVQMAEPGTGNAGKNLEYQQTVDGQYIDYLKFTEIMTQGY